MNIKWSNIISLPTMFISGYLAAIFLANEGSPEALVIQTQDVISPVTSSRNQQMQTKGHQPTSRLQRSNNQIAQLTLLKPQCSYAENEEKSFEEKRAVKPFEDGLLIEISEEELIARADEESEIEAELERIEWEHGSETDDIEDDSVTEISQADLEDQRLDLEMTIAEEMDVLHAGMSFHATDADAYTLALPDNAAGQWSETDMENHRLAMEQAIEIEMELLELVEDSDRNRNGTTGAR